MVIYEPYATVDVSVLVDPIYYEFNSFYAPKDMIAFYVLQAARAIAQKSNCIRREAIIHTQSCAVDYLLEPADCSEVLAIMMIRGWNEIGCSTRVTRVITEPDRRHCNFCGEVLSWFTAPNIIHFMPPRDDFHYKVNFSVLPDSKSCRLDKDFETKYQEIVMDGARSAIYGLGNKPWTNQGKSNLHRQLFESGIRTIANDKLINHQRGMIRAKVTRIL